MENPTNKGRVSCGRFPDATHEAISLSTIRIQHIRAGHGLAIETAAIIATLAFGGAAHG